MPEVQGCFNTASVLIQQSRSSKIKKGGCFNTASVLIQRIYGFVLAIRLIQFQYSFCSYSTKINCNAETQNSCFNTASVLIQPTCQCWEKNFLLRFNTASVLIQLVLNLVQQPPCFVSIQLLFLFNGNGKPIRYEKDRVSIQLLFLFNRRK